MRVYTRVRVRVCNRKKERKKESAREGEIDRLIKLYFSTVKILAQRPTHISAVATVLRITKTFIVKHYDRRIQTKRERESERAMKCKLRCVLL